MHISLQIIIAALSVMGFYFCLKTIASLIFTSKQISAAVIVEARFQITVLDSLLADAASALFSTRRKRLAVLISERVWDECDENEKSYARKVAEDFGAELYFTGTLDFKSSGL